ncbi:hypothetical protein NVS55_09810 [Myxococcus stipitatus]|uniref:hypothetical protein n=1 Tax=Myxococcus stipitatus TaxID=83455 RepID=UPI003144FF33
MCLLRSGAVVLLLVSGVGRAEEPPEPSEFEALEEDITLESGDEELLEPDIEDEEDEGEVEDASPPSSSNTQSRWANRLSLEASTWALLPRRGTGPDERFLLVEPRLEVHHPGLLSLNLVAPVRLRIRGDSAREGLVRKEDWDELSDWGQVVCALTVGGDAPNFIWVGTLDSYTMLSGHLVRRYNNHGNPDYHPAGVVLSGLLKPLYVEAFASDVLGARLMGAEVSLDVEHLFVGSHPHPLRYRVALSAVHDWGRAGGTAEPMTLAHLDGTAVLVSHREGRGGFEFQAHAGWGGRPGTGGAWGVVAGLGAEYMSSRTDLRARLEGRLQRGGFRQGAVGPDYELARFQVAGPNAVPQSEDSFPEGASVHGELIVNWDAERLGVLGQRHLRLTIGTEVFSWGRVDVDGHVETQLFHRNLKVRAGGLAVGVGQRGARYVTSGEVRWRFLGGKLYAVGQGGTRLFPTAEGTLRPGAFASLGLGVDNAR